MRASFLPFSPPSIGREEIDEVTDTLRSDWITTGPKTRRFETEFAGYLGAPAALALNSCTAALHTALVANGIGPGDEVITTPLTFAASVNVIEHVGARPVLVDVEPDTLNIDPVKAEAVLAKNSRALLLVHFAGHPVELDAFHSLAAGRDLLILEDAAHALPARYKGRHIGSGANPVAFSFYATKNLTTAEGGMLTGETGFLECCRLLSLHGMSRDAWKRYGKDGHWYYEVLVPGFKYNMTDIQASIGLWQLKNLARNQERRHRVAEAYNRAFAGESALEIPSCRPEVEHAWHLYVLRLREGVLRIHRNQLIEELHRRNIGTSVHFIPIHLHPYYRTKYGYKPGDFPVAWSNYQRVLSLPLHPRLTDRDVADVIEAVLDVVQRFKK